MIRVATAAEMRELDRRAMEVLGLSGIVLMENAGRSVVDAVERRWGSVGGKAVVVCCGKGNNGGDGFVIARHLANRGARVEVWLLALLNEVKGDAGVNLQVAQRGGVPVHELTDGGGILALRSRVERADLVVDALLGTGLTGPAQGLTAEAIEAINGSGRPVVAVDLPSGLSSDLGELLGPTIKADLTVTFAALKRGLLLYPGALQAGTVEVGDLGIPSSLLNDGLQVGFLTAGDITPLLPPRPPHAHKGTFGHLLVVAGSPGKTGAAAMASLSALRAGAGLVTLGHPRSLNGIFASKLLEVMTESLPETASQCLSLKAREPILELARRMDAVALGPGIGLEAETQGLVRELVRELPCPVVVDADGLSALAGHLGLLKEARGPRLLTPHPGEMARLLGSNVGSVEVDRIETVRTVATVHGAVFALKGARTVIAGPEGPVLVNSTGNAGMATAGSGDVLTGIIGAFLAQGLAPVDAMRGGVYIHGLAGDIAAEGLGQDGLIAGDIMAAIPQAFCRLRR